MALSREDREEIAGIIRGALSSGCLCGLSDGAQKELSHFMGMIKDLGDDSYSQGIERIRASLSGLERMRHLGEKIGSAIVMLVVATVVGGFLAAVWVGIKSAVKQ